MIDSATAPPAGEGTPAGPERPLAVDGSCREAFWRGRRLDLSPTEFAVLACLHRGAGQTVTYDELLQEVWGTSLSQGGTLAQVRSAVTRLRNKLAAAGAQACEIVAVRGTGYRLLLSPASRPRAPLRLTIVLHRKMIAWLVLLLLALLAGCYLWRKLPENPRAVVWYHDQRVPLAALCIMQRGNHCAVAPDGHTYCFDTVDELAAATGLALPGADPEAIRRLQESGAVPDLR